MASAAVCSMTGFASVEGVLAGGRSFTVMVKAVNHRHLDLQVRVPGGFEALEAGLRRVVKAAVKRGHVEVTLFLEKGSAASAVQVDEGLLTAYVEAHRLAAERFGVSAAIDLNGLLRMPGVMSAAAAPVDVAGSEGAVLEAASLATERFNAVRAAEGSALAAELRGGMSAGEGADRGGSAAARRGAAGGGGAAAGEAGGDAGWGQRGAAAGGGGCVGGTGRCRRGAGAAADACGTVRRAAEWRG